jgi:hypothetical protein
LDLSIQSAQPIHRFSNKQGGEATNRGEKQQAGGRSNKQGGEAISRGEKQQAGGSTSNKQGGAEATRGSKSNKKEGAKYIPIPHY